MKMTNFEEIENTMLFICAELEGKAEWAVDGSTALRLYGMKVEPHDLDALTDKAGAEKIAHILREYMEQPLSYGETQKYRSHLCVLKVRGVKVEIMGDLQSYRNGKWTEIQNPRSTGIKFVSLREEKFR